MRDKTARTRIDRGGENREHDFKTVVTDSLDRLEPEIFGWVVVHALAYGKSKF